MARNIKFSDLNYSHDKDYSRFKYNRRTPPANAGTIDQEVQNWTRVYPRRSILDLVPTTTTLGIVACRATLEPRPRKYVPPAEERSASRYKSVGVGDDCKVVATGKRKYIDNRLERKRWHSVRRAARLVTMDTVNRQIERNISCCESRITSWLAEWTMMTLPPPPEQTDFWGIGITDAHECVKDINI